MRNGREVRDTRWTRLLDGTWRLLTSSAGRQEQELDEAGEELYLRGLAHGVVLACGSAKGGSGKTTLTQALAGQLASILKVAVLVLDADLEWGTALNAAPPSARRGDTLVDAYNARERIDSAAQLAPFLVNLRGGAQLLPGPTDAALIEQTGPEQMAAVLALVRRFYPIVLLDLPPGAGFSCGNPIARWGLQEADEILAVATPKKANVDQVRRLLAFLADQYPGKADHARAERDTRAGGPGDPADRQGRPPGQSGAVRGDPLRRDPRPPDRRRHARARHARAADPDRDQTAHPPARLAMVPLTRTRLREQPRQLAALALACALLLAAGAAAGSAAGSSSAAPPRTLTRTVVQRQIVTVTVTVTRPAPVPMPARRRRPHPKASQPFSPSSPRPQAQAWRKAMSRTRRHILIALTLTPVLAAGPKLVAAALETAAGGAGKGSGGFTGFVSFLDNVATYLVFVGAAAGVLGLIASGGMLIAGSPEGGKWLTRTVIGVGIVLLAKGIMA